MVLRNHAQEGSSVFDYGAVTLSCRPFQTARLTRNLITSRNPGRGLLRGPMTPLPQRLPPITWKQFRLFPVRSPLLRESQLMSFPAGTEMFHFPAFPAQPESAGPKFLEQNFQLPHSDIPGSKPARGSPGLFAARYVLRRLLLPRHPPCALYTFFNTHPKARSRIPKNTGNTLLRTGLKSFENLFTTERYTACAAPRPI